MTLDIFNSFEYKGEVKLSNVQALNKTLTEAMFLMCTKLQGDWKLSCYPMIKGACANASWNIGGVIGFFAPCMFCPSIAAEICKDTTLSKKGRFLLYTFFYCSQGHFIHFVFESQPSTLCTLRVSIQLYAKSIHLYGIKCTRTVLGCDSHTVILRE